MTGDRNVFEEELHQQARGEQFLAMLKEAWPSLLKVAKEKPWVHGALKNAFGGDVVLSSSLDYFQEYLIPRLWDAELDLLTLRLKHGVVDKFSEALESLDWLVSEDSNEWVQFEVEDYKEACRKAALWDARTEQEAERLKWVAILQTAVQRLQVQNRELRKLVEENPLF